MSPLDQLFFMTNPIRPMSSWFIFWHLLLLHLTLDVLFILPLHFFVFFQFFFSFFLCPSFFFSCYWYFCQWKPAINTQGPRSFKPQHVFVDQQIWGISSSFLLKDSLTLDKRGHFSLPCWLPLPDLPCLLLFIPLLLFPFSFLGSKIDCRNKLLCKFYMKGPTFFQTTACLFRPTNLQDLFLPFI